MLLLQEIWIKDLEKVAIKCSSSLLYQYFKKSSKKRTFISWLLVRSLCF